MIGRTLSHYRVLELLGQGGMGDVYLAEDQRLQRPVALKVLREECCDGDALQQLLREARTASALSHPGIAIVYEVDEAETEGTKRSFIVMEYVAGQPLDAYVRARDLDLDGILELAIQVAETLVAAHGRGVVHRDIKPSNILVTEAGRAKVLDFGVAMQLPLADARTVTFREGEARTWAGTVAYMSPEQALGREIDARSDQFSLAVVLYELVAGAKPFVGGNAGEVLDALLHRDPPPLPAGADPRRAALAAVLRRMLAKDRAERYGSLEQVLADLRAVRSGGAAALDVASPAARPSEAPGGPAVAILGFTNITGRVEDDWLGTGLAESVTADLKALGGLLVVSRDRIEDALRRLGGERGDEALAAKVGRRLGARWVLAGGFQRLGDVVRVTARLTEVETGTVARTVKLDGQLAELFALQDRVAAEVASGLRPGLLATPESDETPVVAAYEALSRGLMNLRMDTYETLDRAILFFERAAELDPRYARALVELGAAYAQKAEHLVSAEYRERAAVHLRRALDLRPGLARAWRELGMVLVTAGRDDEGLAMIRRALELAPDDSTVVAGYARGLFLGPARFAEAAEYFERSLAINPHAGWYWLQLAHCRALLREFAPGEHAARQAIALQEAFLSGREGVSIVGSYMRLGHLMALQERRREAIEHFEAELAFLQRVDHALRSRIAVELHMRRGAALLGLGESERGRSELATAIEIFDHRAAMGADDPFTRYYAAAALALSGDVERALEYLARAIEQRPAFTRARARQEPEFASLAGAARFRSLVGA